MKYEYMTISVSTIDPTMLDEYGNRGWRLVQVVTVNELYKTIIWEREVK